MHVDDVSEANGRETRHVTRNAKPAQNNEARKDYAMTDGLTPGWRARCTRLKRRTPGSTWEGRDAPLENAARAFPGQSYVNELGSTIGINEFSHEKRYLSW